MSDKKTELNLAAQPSPQPRLHQHSKELQAYGTLTQYNLALAHDSRAYSVGALNQLLADTIVLRDMYKKHHWQVSGPTFYQLHLLFDKHYEAQVEIVDLLAERVQSLGGVALAMGVDASEVTKIPRPPRGREEAPAQISRLLEAHSIILEQARASARRASELGDDGTNDLIVSDVIRGNELQVWFLAEHLVDVPLNAKR
jgi:starvation-inducible DNA-binding protein